jgi:hypothetical protein
MDTFVCFFDCDYLRILGMRFASLILRCPLKIGSYGWMIRCWECRKAKIRVTVGCEVPGIAAYIWIARFGSLMGSI